MCELDPLVGAVEAAVAGLRGSDPAELGGSALAERMVRVEVLLARLSAHRLGCIEVLDAGGAPQVSAAGSTRAWLRERVRLGPGAAVARVALARRLTERPAVAAALVSGAVSTRHAQLLARTVTELGPRVADRTDLGELERGLLVAAEQTDPLRLSDVCARVRYQLAVVDAEYQAVRARRLSISRSLDGMVAVDGLLDPVTGETVLAAMHACSAPAGPADARSPGQRRADALGDRPQVLVTVSLDTVRCEPGCDPGELRWAGLISGELARRVGCDASIIRILLDPHGQPLDVGRATRVVGAGLRRALLVRDRTCRDPGAEPSRRFRRLRLLGPAPRRGLGADGSGLPRILLG